jgi:7,8-dihydroneopterin aldolase/epimerase/oxygenase
VKRLKSFAADHPHKLLERFAQAIADLLLADFGAPWAKVRVAKLAPIAGVRELGVVVERKRTP